VRAWRLAAVVDDGAARIHVTQRSLCRRGPRRQRWFVWFVWSVHNSRDLHSDGRLPPPGLLLLLRRLRLLLRRPEAERIVCRCVCPT
jgi:hypothetical protein